MKPLPAVIAVPEHQQAQVHRLADYCRRLDGTELMLVPVSAEMDRRHRAECGDNWFACLQANALRQEALFMQGRPFIHLEPDSIPLRKGWRNVIASEYQRLGRCFLLPEMPEQDAAMDLASGVGVYGPDTHWLIPNKFPGHGWDLWMGRHLERMIARTSLIQHTYGKYDSSGRAEPWMFPRDSGVIRPGVVLFHRDKFQGLIQGKTILSFYHTGDLGDIIAALPVIRKLGGGELVIGNHLNPAWRKMEGDRYEAIRPLLQAQPYISSVSFQHHQQHSGATHDFREFRQVYKGSRTLTDSQAEWVQAGAVDMAPWLMASPVDGLSDRIVVARTDRYRNPRFPWARLCQAHRKRMLFVGTNAEHRQFESEFRVSVEYRPTANLLQLAEIIAGAGMFIGNQSSPFWIAAGLGKRLIQETHPTIRDSVVPGALFRYFGLSTPDPFREFGLL